jgi:lipopolysaccharide/colanic/teichoic acid biosynthesis glycosyltransferase
VERAVDLPPGTLLHPEKKTGAFMRRLADDERVVTRGEFAETPAGTHRLEDPSEETRARVERELHQIHPNRPASRKPVRPPVGGVTKRAFDIVVSGLALILLAPLFLVVGLLVRITSRGPAFFRQRRGGLKGRTFLVFKFRTMTTMDDGSEVKQAVRRDARVTPLGGFLRRTSLDELPQLINVFVGDMSIVGPRPHAVAHDIAFQAIDPNYVHRQRARPGMTGLAQISGCRGLIETNKHLRDRVRYDNAYIDRWSFWLDLWIIAKTVLLVLNDDQAF